MKYHVYRTENGKEKKLTRRVLSERFAVALMEGIAKEDKTTRWTDTGDFMWRSENGDEIWIEEA